MKEEFTTLSGNISTCREEPKAINRKGQRMRGFLKRKEKLRCFSGSDEFITTGGGPNVLLNSSSNGSTLLFSQRRSEFENYFRSGN